MNITVSPNPHPHPSLPAAWRRVGALLALSAVTLLLGACGGGGGSGVASVNNISASGMAYLRTMTVTVNGAGLDNPEIFMTVEGPCGATSRVGTGTDSQVQFSCQVTGVGSLSPRIRRGNGDELGRITVNVPLPQVSFAVRQGTNASANILVEIDPAAAPASAFNFISYVNNNFYRDTLIHRVVTDKLVQGGGYTAGPTLKPPTAGTIILESNNGLKNLRGTIAMARTSVSDSATSQFYFNVSDNPEFDYVSAEQPGYAVFGRIVSGLDALDQLGRVATRSVSDALPAVPVTDIVVTSVLQTR